MMKKIVIPAAFVLVVLLSVIAGLGVIPSNSAQATTSAAHMPHVLPTIVPGGTIGRVFNCAGGGDGFFNIHADGDKNWDCFANAGTITVQIWGADEFCTGDNTGRVYVQDNHSDSIVNGPEKFKCYSLGGGYHRVVAITIN